MTRKEQNKILDDKIGSNNNQYKIDRLNAEISAFSSGDLNKFEFLTRKDSNYKPNALDKARFEFSPLGRAFNEGLDKTIPNYQEEGVIKLLKEIRDNLAGGINIPAGLIIPPGPPGPGGQPGQSGPQGPIPPAPPIPIIPVRTPSPQRPKLPSEKKSDYDDVSKQLNDVNKQLNDVNKQIDDLLNKIKSKQSSDLVNDIVNNIRNRRLDSPDFISLKNLVDEINKDQSDQIDYDELEELAKVNSELSRLKSLDPLMPIPDLSSTRKSNIPISSKKPSSKVRDNVTDNLEISGPGPGIRFAIRTKEFDIENDYDDIKYLENKSHDTSLSFDEHSKIFNNIIQIKKIYLNKKKN